MTDLIATLIDLGALAKDSMVTARHGTQNKYGAIIYTTEEYVLQDIAQQDAKLCLKQANGSAIISAHIRDITAIDGMSLDRYADIYNVNPDGTLKSMGRKRGRKPKIR
jgi:hypothetical protein